MKSLLIFTLVLLPSIGFAGEPVIVEVPGLIPVTREPDHCERETWFLLRPGVSVTGPTEAGKPEAMIQIKAGTMLTGPLTIKNCDGFVTISNEGKLP